MSSIPIFAQARGNLAQAKRGKFWGALKLIFAQAMRFLLKRAHSCLN